MKVRELIEDLQGFVDQGGADMEVRYAIGRDGELQVLSIYAVTKAEAKRQGLKKKAHVGLWIDLGEKK